MNYCTLDDIKKKRIPEGTLIQLTDDSGTGTLDQEKVDAAIAEAGALIDGYLRTRYPLPLAPVPPLLTPLASAIAAWQLYGLRAEFATPDRIKDDYKGALDTLKLIQKGDVRLFEESTAGAAAAAEQESTLRVQTPPALFSRDVLDGY